jgi:hypothetical protein
MSRNEKRGKMKPDYRTTGLLDIFADVPGCAGPK